MGHIAKADLKEYNVWDRTVRWFHWINFVSVLGLIVIGTVILFSKELGIGNDGKVLLKTVHVLTGYVFVVNLAWRAIWGFIGSRYARWGAILPFGRGYMADLREYSAGFRMGDAPGWLGHNPVGKLMVAALFAVLLAMGGSGLMLAGTDIYFPPFGGSVKSWIAEDRSNLDVIKPYSKENVNEARFEEMRAFRKPFITTHETLYYVLLALAAAHIAGAVVTEIRERNGIISAMFTGRKVFGKRPVDYRD